MDGNWRLGGFFASGYIFKCEPGSAAVGSLVFARVH